ncbi:unnamed protein product [Tilletia laevis]|nr:unnamed protein product [Tilletia laevis]
MNPTFHHGHSGPNPNPVFRRRHLKASASLSSSSVASGAGGSGTGLILPTSSSSHRAPPTSQDHLAGPNMLTKKRNWTPSYPVLPPDFNGNFVVGAGGSSGNGSAASSGFHQMTGPSSGSGGATAAAIYGLPTANIPLPSSRADAAYADHTQQQHLQGLGESTYASAHATFSATQSGTALNSTARLHRQSQQHQQSQANFPQEEHTDGPAPKRRKGVAGAIIDGALSAAIGTLAAGLTAWSLYSTWGQRAEHAAREELMHDERSPAPGQGRRVERAEGEEEQRRRRGERLQSPVVGPHEEPPPPYHDDLSLSTPASPGGRGGGGPSRSGVRQTPIYISGQRRKTRPNYRSYRSMRTGNLAGDAGSNSGASTPNRPGMFSQRQSFSQAGMSSELSLGSAPHSVPPPIPAPIEPVTAVKGEGDDDDDDAFMRVNTNLASLIAEGQAALNAPVDDDMNDDDEDEHLPALMNPAMHTPLHATTRMPRGGGIFGHPQQQQQHQFSARAAPNFDFNFGNRSEGPRSHFTPGGSSTSAALGTGFQTPPSTSPFVFSGGGGGNRGGDGGVGGMTTPPRGYLQQGQRSSHLPRPSPGNPASPYARGSTGPSRAAGSGSGPSSASGGLLLHRRTAGAARGRSAGNTPQSASRAAASGSGKGGRQVTSPDLYGSDIGRRERPRWA